MDSIYSSDAIITMQDTEITILSNDKIIKAQMLKNDGEEFIIEHNSVQYFMKRFGK
jgi:hemin uptake protein HemP